MTEPLNVLIAGAGVGALETALALDELAGDRVSITLVGPDPYLHYRALAVHSPFDGRPVQRFSIGAIAADRGWTVLRDAVTRVDASARQVLTEAYGAVRYDTLVVATGAAASELLPGAVPFRGPQDVERFGHVLAALGRGEIRHLAFVVPSGVAWALPAYELALQTARFIDENALQARVALITRERSPLAAFGATAGAAVAELLTDAGVDVRAGVHADHAIGGRLDVGISGSVLADRVVSMPILRGPFIPGLPCDADGFLVVDEYGRVADVASVYAVGDVCARGYKQGGLAAEQADAVASSLASLAGAAVTPVAYRPVLRGVLVTGGDPLYLLHDPDAHESVASTRPLWTPPHKIFGLRLAPYLEANPDLAVAPHVTGLA